MLQTMQVVDICMDKLFKHYDSDKKVLLFNLDMVIKIIKVKRSQQPR